MMSNGVELIWDVEERIKNRRQMKSWTLRKNVKNTKLKTEKNIIVYKNYSDNKTKEDRLNREFV